MEISLKSLALTHPAFSSARSATIVAELIWPRPAISSRVGFQSVSLRKGKTALGRTPYYERLLLKEKVDGRFGIRVGITKPGAQFNLNPALAEILSTALSSIGGTLAAPFSSAALRPLLREPLNQLADKIDPDEPTVVAEAGLDLHSDDDWIGEKSFVLKTNKSLKIPIDNKVGPRTKDVAKKQKFQTIRKGSVIAEVVLALAE